MKSDGVKDVVKWMEEQIKLKKASMGKDYSAWDDLGVGQSELAVMVSWKISTEKYMKKLKHNGE